MTLKTVSSLLLLLLLVSIIRGLQDVQVLEAIVGQNISLPCTAKEANNSTIVNTEWNKKDKEDTKPYKLALYAPGYGYRFFSPNVNLTIINDNAGKLVGTKLELYNLDKGHAGTYICDYASFPLGTRQSKTVLRIKDQIECDKNSTIVEVKPGENVTIHCSEFTDVNYTWTKDKTVVSDSPFLQLLSVSEAMAGIYTLMVNTGSNCLVVNFTITVQTKTTNLYTDVTTLMADHSSNGVPDTTLVNSSETDYAQSSVPTIPTTHIQPDHQNTSTVPTYTIYNQSESFNTSQSFSSNTSFNQSESFTASFNQSASTILNYNQTIETTTSFNAKYMSLVTETNSNLNKTDLLNDSLSKSFTNLNPTISLRTTTLDHDATQTSRPGNTTDVTVQQDPGDLDGQSHLLMMTLIIVGMLLLGIVTFILCRRRVIKERMDRPPPFKPPPPPVKYIAARSPPQHFPTDRCNSIPAATMETRHTFV